MDLLTGQLKRPKLTFYYDKASVNNTRPKQSLLTQHCYAILMETSACSPNLNPLFILFKANYVP